MTFFTEQPLRLGLVCLSLVLVAGIVLLQTRRKPAAVALGIMILATGALLAIERAVVTDAEQITALLHAAVADVAANDLEAVLSRLSPQASELAAEVKATMPQLQFEEVKITSTPEIRLRMTGEPASAAATFRARANATFQGLPTGPLLPQVTIELVREAAGWKILDADYEFSSPLGQGGGGP